MQPLVFIASSADLEAVAPSPDTYQVLVLLSRPRGDDEDVVGSLDGEDLARQVALELQSAYDDGASGMFQVVKVGADLSADLNLIGAPADGKMDGPRDWLSALSEGVGLVQALVDARKAGRSMVDASTNLEDWAVNVADMLPDEPPAPLGPFDPAVEAPDMRLERGDLAVTLEYIGEGFDGDYDPEDKGDEPLMRIALERRVDGEWGEVDDTSYCTQISARASPEGKQAVMEWVLTHAPNNHPKRFMERVSWTKLDAAETEPRFPPLI